MWRKSTYLDILAYYPYSLKILFQNFFYYLIKLIQVIFLNFNLKLNSLYSILNITNQWKIINNINFLYIYDYLLLFIFKNILSYKKLYVYLSRWLLRNKQLSWTFYPKSFFVDTSYTLFQNLINTTLNGLLYLWKIFKFWIIGLLLGIVIFYYLTVTQLLPFNKIIFEWVLITMFVYWLMSGFVFFVRKYRYSKFTTVIQRFWKRTYILFWLIETGVFLTFLYLTLNASEEPVYMYDQMKLYKTHLFSWRLFLLKLIPTVALIIVGYYLQLTLRWGTFNKQSVYLLILTLLMLYIVWLEFYQFFHIINFYSNIYWTYDYETLLWNLDIDFRRTRLSNNYVAVCLLAKFWHLIFIFLFWVFFVLRVQELKRVRYLFFAANQQNFIILYFMSWLFMYPWFKFIFRKQLDIPYYWFFFSNRDLSWRIFFNDLKLWYFSIFNNINIGYLNFKYYTFFYWEDFSTNLGFNFYKKHIIRSQIIDYLNS